MNWDKIIGHQDNIGLLRKMLSSRAMPHALLFTGMSGIGKMLSAKVFAAGILCAAEGERPCGSCFSCLSYSRGQHPDIKEVRPDGGASLSIKIDQIRALKRFALLSPALTKGRVCVVEDAQNMTEEASNSLLKLLEEPPSNFYFILVASIGQPLLPTIVSRCLRVDFLPLSPAVLAEKLIEKNGIDSEKARTAANLSGGRMGKAIELMQPEGFALRNLAAEYLELLSGGDAEKLEEHLDSFNPSSRQEVLAFLEYVCVLMRDMLFLVIDSKESAMQTTNIEEYLLNPDLARKISNLAPYWDEESLLFANKKLRAAIRAVSGNANVKLTIDALTIKLKHISYKGT